MKITVDSYIHSNPAFVAFALHHVAGGLAAAAASQARALSPFEGIWAISLLAPDTVRNNLPKKPGKLPMLLDEHPEWRNSFVALRYWVDPFWEGLRYGCGARALTWKSGVVAIGTTKPTNGNELAAEVRERGRVLGRMIATASDSVRLVGVLGGGFE